jgi:hypothetical protein
VAAGILTKSISKSGASVAGNSSGKPSLLSWVDGLLSRSAFWIGLGLIVVFVACIMRLSFGTTVNAQVQPQTTGDFVTILGPLLAISVALERIIEKAFAWFENASRSAAKILKTPVEALDWTGQQYQRAYAAVEELIKQLQGTPTNNLEKLGELEAAKLWLKNAEEWLSGWVKSPEYVAKKRALSIYAGLVAGLSLSILGDLTMMRYIGINTPLFLDVIATGLIIGAGPGPMHSIIGILQEGKDALARVATTAKSDAEEINFEAQNLVTLIKQTRTGQP